MITTTSSPAPLTLFSNDESPFDVPQIVPDFASSSAPSLLDNLRQSGTKLWLPERVVFTPAALEYAHGKRIYERVRALGLPIEIEKNNRITGLRGDDERATYNKSKRTLAVVVAPPSQFKLQPIPPSADWQFHLAEGCPAHCQYCYLAGSLSGPPVVRAYANLDEILENLKNFVAPDAQAPSATSSTRTTFEVSCYTDPLSLEHLTGSLSHCIAFFGREMPLAQLRWVSKFDGVDELLSIEHSGATRCRVSVNAPWVSKRFEGGTAQVAARLAALRKLATPRDQGGGGYAVGVVVAPIMAIDDWKDEYSLLLDDIEISLDFPCDLTFELITHRFTPGSRDVLQGWYPKSQLDMSEEGRELKRNKFGGAKYVYPRDKMKEMRAWFSAEIARRFPHATLLYWT